MSQTMSAPFVLGLRNSLVGGGTGPGEDPAWPRGAQTPLPSDPWLEQALEAHPDPYASWSRVPGEKESCVPAGTLPGVCSFQLLQENPLPCGLPHQEQMGRGRPHCGLGWESTSFFGLEGDISEGGFSDGVGLGRPGTLLRVGPGPTQDSSL